MIQNWLMGAFTNPIVILAAVAAFFFFGYTNTQHENQQLKQQASAYEQIFKAQERSLQIQERDFQLLGDFQKKGQVVVIKQQDTNRKIDAIPDTSTNKPFTNSELRDAASILRDHQIAAFPPTNPPSSNSR
jgi:type II secretory pathway pseudopilin PulG